MVLLGIIVLLLIGATAIILFGLLLHGSSIKDGMYYEKCDKVSCSGCYDKEQCSIGRSKTK